jgi:SAM-dependent methyltransferase
MADTNNLVKDVTLLRIMNNHNIDHLMQAHEAHFGEQSEDFRFGFFANQGQFNIRNSHLSKVIISILKTTEAGILVDLGCNVGYFGPILKNFSSNTIGVDFSLNALLWCKKLNRYTTIVKSSFRHLPFSTNSVSGVLLLDCLSIYSNTEIQQILSEAYRVLKPGGILIFENNARSIKPVEFLRFILSLVRRLIAKKPFTLASLARRYTNFYHRHWRGINIKFPPRRQIFQNLRELGFIEMKVHDRKYMHILPRQRIILTCKKSPRVSSSEQATAKKKHFLHT